VQPKAEASANRLDTFNQYRPLLFSIAYRMLGTAMDAEDVLQEAFLRWEQAAADDVQSPKSYLAAVVTRLCIDFLRSAQAQREAYVGPWLPEPVLTGQNTGLADTMMLNESLSMAFLVLLENLFLLRQVFDYDYDEIARIVDKSEANCRQMVRRARQHIEARRPRYEVSAEQRDRLTTQFVQTLSTGDMEGFLALLADDIVLMSDGGGKVAAALNPIYGADKVARYLFSLSKRLQQHGLEARLAEVNGQPGLIVYIGGQLDNVLVLDITGERIRHIHIVRNPDKLRGVAGGWVRLMCGQRPPINRRAKRTKPLRG
jgi:RNA polymerase sigma-70 factor, ECF subfamily